MPDITTEYLALRDQYIEARFARLNAVQRQAVFATEGLSLKIINGII